MSDLRLTWPKAGHTETVESTEHTRFVLDFPSADALTSRDGSDLVFSFSDGAHLRVINFYTTYHLENMPEFVLDGFAVSGEAFFTALGDEDLMPAADAATLATDARFHNWEDSELAEGLDKLGGLDLAFDPEEGPTPTRSGSIVAGVSLAGFDGSDGAGGTGGPLGAPDPGPGPDPGPDPKPDPEPGPGPGPDPKPDPEPEPGGGAAVEDAADKVFVRLLPTPFMRYVIGPGDEVPTQQIYLNPETPFSLHLCDAQGNPVEAREDMWVKVFVSYSGKGGNGVLNPFGSEMIYSDTEEIDVFFPAGASMVFAEASSGAAYSYMHGYIQIAGPQARDFEPFNFAFGGIGIDTVYEGDTVTLRVVPWPLGPEAMTMETAYRMVVGGEELDGGRVAFNADGTVTIPVPLDMSNYSVYQDGHARLDFSVSIDELYVNGDRAQYVDFLYGIEFQPWTTSVAQPWTTYMPCRNAVIDAGIDLVTDADGKLCVAVSLTNREGLDASPGKDADGNDCTTSVCFNFIIDGDWYRFNIVLTGDEWRKEVAWDDLLSINWEPLPSLDSLSPDTVVTLQVVSLSHSAYEFWETDHGGVVEFPDFPDLLAAALAAESAAALGEPFEPAVMALAFGLSLSSDDEENEAAEGDAVGMEQTSLIVSIDEPLFGIESAGQNPVEADGVTVAGGCYDAAETMSANGEIDFLIGPDAHFLDTLLNAHTLEDGTRHIHVALDSGSPHTDVFLQADGDLNLTSMADLTEKLGITIANDHVSLDEQWEAMAEQTIDGNDYMQWQHHNTAGDVDATILVQKSILENTQS